MKVKFVFMIILLENMKKYVNRLVYWYLGKTERKHEKRYFFEELKDLVKYLSIRCVIC